MKKIVVGGQLGKKEIEELVRNLSDNQLEIIVKSDLEAAMALQSGQVDYYVGACETGSGGALAMAIALVGADKCLTLASPSKLLTEEEIRQAVGDGKKAFGFTIGSAKNVLPVLITELIK